MNLSQDEILKLATEKCSDFTILINGKKEFTFTEQDIQLFANAIQALTKAGE